MKNLFNWIKAIVIWIMKEKNRGVALKYVNMGLNILKVLAPYTKTKADDKAIKGLEHTLNQVYKLSYGKEKDQIASMIETINSDNDKLKGLNLKYNIKKNEAEASLFGLLKGSVDFDNGDIKIGI